MKTITLTDEQEQFINGITDNMEMQSNRSTRYPLFYVYEKEEIAVDGDGYADRIAFYNPTTTNLTDEEEDENGNIWKFDGDWSGQWKCEETGEVIEEHEAEEKLELRKLY